MPMGLRGRLVAELPHLRRFARALTRDPVEADDLVQDVVVRALGGLHLLRNRASLRSWLFRITYRIHLDTRARMGRGPVYVDPLEPGLEPVVPGSQHHRLDLRDMTEAFHQLPAEQKAAIVLVAVEGMSYAEAARVLDIPQGTLISRLHRGRARLRILIEGEEAPATPRPRLRAVE